MPERGDYSFRLKKLSIRPLLYGGIKSKVTNTKTTNRIHKQVLKGIIYLQSVKPLNFQASYSVLEIKSAIRLTSMQMYAFK